MEIVIIVILLVVIYAVIQHYNPPKECTMSFKESLDLTNLPIITFVNNGTKLNFLLDTGATTSIIDMNVLPSLEYNLAQGKAMMYGLEGKTVESHKIIMDLSYKDILFSEEFQVMDLSVTFGQIKEDFGVNLHGILSNNFFQKYKYIIDFKELIAYPTRWKI